MFTPERRDQVRARLLELAREDPAVSGAAITGSHTVGLEDEWSDIDVAFGIAGDLEAALGRWTERLEADFGALHYWDLPVGSTIYRVFLLPDLLQVDILFMPESDFAPAAPTWRTVFGQAGEQQSRQPIDPRELIGWAWTACLHARRSIERGKPWQAEHMINDIRQRVISLACLREGLPTRHGKGADRLPAELTEPLEATLVRSLDERELRRALGAAVDALAGELERTDSELAARLQPTLEAVLEREDPAVGGP